MTPKLSNLILFGFTLMVINSAVGQSKQQEKMKQLSFMIGDWVGVSSLIENDKVVSSIPAYQSISYQVDQHIICINLKSETLTLHTVIYYDEDLATYFYNPYYKKGSAKYPAQFSEGNFIVKASKNKRFVFCLTLEGNFQEYGEVLKDGKWQKYFEDNFK